MPTPRRHRAAAAVDRIAREPSRAPAPPAPARPLPPPLPLAQVRRALLAATAAFGSDAARLAAADLLEQLVPSFRTASGPIPQQLGRRLSRLARALRTNSLEAAQLSHDKALVRLHLLCPEGAPAG